MSVTIFASFLQMGDSSQTLIPSPVQKFYFTPSLAEIQPLHPYLKYRLGGNGVAVVAHWSLNSEVRGSSHRPYVGKLLVSYQWSEVYIL